MIAEGLRVWFLISRIPWEPRDGSLVASLTITPRVPLGNLHFRFGWTRGLSSLMGVRGCFAKGHRTPLNLSLWLKLSYFELLMPIDQKTEKGDAVKASVVHPNYYEEIKLHNGTRRSGSETQGIP